MKRAGAPGTPWFTEDPTWLWDELEKYQDFHLLNNEVYEDEDFLVGGLYLPPEYYGCPKIGESRSASQWEHLAGVKEDYGIFLDNLINLQIKMDRYENVRGKYRVLLSHAPKYLGKSYIEKLWHDQFDCCLAGHVHNYFLPNNMAWFRAKIKGWLNKGIYAFPPFQTAVDPKFQRFYSRWVTEVNFCQDGGEIAFHQIAV